MSRLLFIDVSNNNGSIDWPRVARAGVKGAFLKASEGANFVDGTFRHHRAAANSVGIRVGAYHFARPNGGDAILEAHHFCYAVGSLGRRDLRPVLDLEVSRLPMRALAGWARTWNHTVKGRFGCWPLFYSFSAFVQEMHADRPIGGGLWLADFGRNDGREHHFRVPAPWRHAVAHQFTSEGLIPGVRGRVDESAVPNMRPLLAHPTRGLL